MTRRANVKDELLERVAYFIGWIMVGYLYFRFWDALSMTYTYQAGRTEGLAILTRGVLSFNFWFVEILLGAVVPIILLLNKKTRMMPAVRMLALAMIVAGVVTYRWDTNLVGQLVMVSYLPGDLAVSYTSYRPALIEWLAGMGIIAYGLMLFSVGVRYLRVVDHTIYEEAHVPVAEQVPAHGQTIPTQSINSTNKKMDAARRPFFVNHRILLFNRAGIDPLLEKIKFFSGEIAKMLFTLHFDQLAVRRIAWNDHRAILVALHQALHNWLTRAHQERYRPGGTWCSVRPGVAQYCIHKSGCRAWRMVPEL